jgi:23S rRNA pseudouridine2605 synthase
LRDERPARDERPRRDDRSAREERPARDARPAHPVDRAARPAPRPRADERPARSRDDRPARGEDRPARPARPAPRARPLPTSSRVAKDAESMRIQRALARAGVISRRKAEELVLEGRVTVNGAPATTGQVVDPARDDIRVDGEAIGRYGSDVWMVLHKPGGYITSRGDPEGRPTVFDLVEDVPGLTYVGRLDFMTEGVLLLTTDGAAAHHLTHPSTEIERTYVATVRGNAHAAARAARDGVELEDGLVTPLSVEVDQLGGRKWAFTVTIAEGRNREVRRLCEAVGLEVERLVRTRFGPVTLGELELGKTRAVTPREMGLIRALVGKG